MKNVKNLLHKITTPAVMPSSVNPSPLTPLTLTWVCVSKMDRTFSSRSCSTALHSACTKNSLHLDQELNSGACTCSMSTSCTKFINTCQQCSAGYESVGLETLRTTQTRIRNYLYGSGSGAKSFHQQAKQNENLKF
jgi:hypothetical protein